MTARLILNPTAGRGGEADQVEKLARSLKGVEIRRTQAAGDAAAMAREAVEQGVELLLVAGGDGTISEVVNGIAPDFDAVRLLIIPLGTGNDFARTLGLPWDAAAALALIDTGQEQRIDLIHVDTPPPRYLINAATGGFSEHVHARLDDDTKARWGPFAYLRAAIEVVPEIPDYHVRLMLDGEPIETQACSLIVANGRFAGGGIELAPAAELNDRQIDVMLVTAQTFLERLRVASRMAIGTHLDAEGVLFRRGRVLEVDAEPTMGFSSDGELIGETPLRFRMVPQAVRVLVPSQPERSAAAGAESAEDHR